MEHNNDRPLARDIHFGGFYDTVGMLWILPWTEATTGTGKAVEKMNERPRDWIKLFHRVLLNTFQNFSY